MIAILSKDALARFLTTHFKSGTIYHDLEDGHVILSGECRDMGTEDEVRSQPEISCLPDVMDNEPIEDRHVDRLQHLGIKKGHTTHQVRKEIRKIRKNF